MRQLREELYAGSRHLRGRLQPAGYEPFRFRGTGDLWTLPTSTLVELRSIDPGELVIRPTPKAMKELWPFSRKLALVMAGSRAGRLLEEAYQPLFATEEEGLAVTWTKTDVDLAAELGARVLDLCGLGPSSRLTSLLPSDPSFDSLMLTHGATRAQVTMDEDSPVVAAAAKDGAALVEARDIDLLLLFGLPDKALRDTAAARGTELATIWTCGPARMAAVEAPGDEGLRFFPDLVAAEILDPDTTRPTAGDSVGELVLTNVGSHGTALLRYRTEVKARLDWSPRSPFGALPRLIPSS